MQLITQHKQKNHSAIIAGEKSKAFSTEIELVQYLQKRGIDLRQFNHQTLTKDNSNFECTTLWTKN